MSAVFSGTWIAALPRQGVQTKMTFSSTNSTVQVQPVGGETIYPGIWAEDGNGNFIIQATIPPSEFNSVWSGTIQVGSGKGFYVEYSHHRQLAGLEPATFTRVG